MSVLATDDFNRADSASLGGNWTTVSTLSAPGILSNAWATQSATDHGSRYTGITWPNDQYSQVASLGHSASSDGGPFARGDPSAESFYVVDADPSNNYDVYKVVTGGFTRIINSSQVISANDVLRVEAQGTTIRSLYNGGSKGTITDSALTAGAAGIFESSGDAATTGRFDNFEGGDFAAGGMPPGLGPSEDMTMYDMSGISSMMR